MTATIDYTERIQRLAGDIADRYPDSETHAATQAIIAHLGALEASIARLRTAFLRAESRVESWEANQDQTTAIWLARWGLEPDDLPGVRIGADARGDLDGDVLRMAGPQRGREQA